MLLHHSSIRSYARRIAVFISNTGIFRIRLVPSPQFAYWVFWHQTDRTKCCFECCEVPYTKSTWISLQLDHDHIVLIKRTVVTICVQTGHHKFTKLNISGKCRGYDSTMDATGLFNDITYTASDVMENKDSPRKRPLAKLWSEFYSHHMVFIFKTINGFVDSPVDVQVHIIAGLLPIALIKQCAGE